MRRSWTPGRVNLIGEWIDFNGGQVLPAALPLGVRVTLEPAPGKVDRVQSTQFPGRREAACDAVAEGGWADYVFGALQSARREGWLNGPAWVTLDSDIPAGAGVSSSAAVTIGVLRAAAPDHVDLTRIAQLGREVENAYIGVPCGIMDQMAVAHALPGEAIALDTRSLNFERLTLPKGWCFTILHSGVERELADGRYKARRDACLTAARLSGVDQLCHARSVDGLPDALVPITRHVIDEDRRVTAAITAWRAGQAAEFGALMTASHASLRDDFQVSTPAVDALVADLCSHGVHGARITGAGFGGCVVVLTTPETPVEWMEGVLRRHPAVRLVCRVDAAAGM